MKSSRLFGIGAISLWLSACALIPYPHRSNLTPHVVGVVKGDVPSDPVQTASVCESAREQCCTGKVTAEAEVVNGQFEVPAIREMQFFVRTMAHQRFYWCLTLGSRNAALVAGPFARYALVDTGPVGITRLTCEFRDGAWSCAEVLDGGRVTPIQRLRRIDPSQHD